jgi:hypothetical protein
VEEVGVSLCVAYWFCCGRKLTSTLGPERRLTKGARGNIERKLDIEVTEQRVGNVTSTYVKSVNYTNVSRLLELDEGADLQ